MYRRVGVYSSILSVQHVYLDNTKIVNFFKLPKLFQVFFKKN